MRFSLLLALKMEVKFLTHNFKLVVMFIKTQVVFLWKNGDLFSEKNQVSGIDNKWFLFSFDSQFYINLNLDGFLIEHLLIKSCVVVSDCFYSQFLRKWCQNFIGFFVDSDFVQVIASRFCDIWKRVRRRSWMRACPPVLISPRRSCTS